MASASPARRTGTNDLPPVKEGSDLLSAWRDMSPEERDALNQAIKRRHAAGVEKRRPKVSPTQLERFEQKTRDYRLEGKTAWLEPHRDALRSFVVMGYEAGADNLDDLRILRKNFAEGPVWVNRQKYDCYEDLGMTPRFHS